MSLLKHGKIMCVLIDGWGKFLMDGVPKKTYQEWVWDQRNQIHIQLLETGLAKGMYYDH